MHATHYAVLMHPKRAGGFTKQRGRWRSPGKDPPKTTPASYGGHRGSGGATHASEGALRVQCTAEGGDPSYRAVQDIWSRCWLSNHLYMAGVARNEVLFKRSTTCGIFKRPRWPAKFSIPSVPVTRRPQLSATFRATRSSRIIRSAANWTARLIASRSPRCSKFSPIARHDFLDKQPVGFLHNPVPHGIRSKPIAQLVANS